MMDQYEAILLQTTELVQGRIKLRAFRASDAADVFEYGRDEATVKYLVWNAFGALADAKANISGYYSSRPGIYAIELVEESKCIGCISIGLDVDNDKANFGYVLNRSYWNKGYMTEALDAILRLCFDRLQVNRVEGAHYVGNEASGRVMEKAGMTKEGVGIQEVKVKGIFRDVVHYGMVRTQWKIKV